MSADLVMVEKFFTIRKTVIEMLLDRGYLVSDSEVKLDFAGFHSNLERHGFKYVVNCERRRCKFVSLCGAFLTPVACSRLVL